MKCEHTYVTSYGKGWVRCACGVRLLSLICPIELGRPV